MPSLRHLSSVLWFLPLAWLWFRLIDHLRVEWSVNPQYAYGWAVPLLCLFLLWQRMEGGGQKAEGGGQKAEGGAQKAEDGDQPCGFRPPASGLWLLILALLYLPTRLIEEANPEWRLVSWALALEVIGLTLLLLPLALRCLPFALLPLSLAQIAFPIVFFLVAVPWPTIVEGPLIQALTRANTGITIEVMNLLGVPALQHGNVIEVGTGMVGIDEACSGIRSFQASLMISLFLGEFYRLNPARRLVLCASGFALSFVFNVGRTSVLTFVAARKGLAAIESWHDPTGVSILVSSFLVLWGLGVWLAGTGQRAKDEARSAEGEAQRAESKGQSVLSPLPPCALPLALRALPFALFVWLVVTELGVEAWYRFHESRAQTAPQWTVAWPTNNAAFTELPFPDSVRQLLRFDEGRNAAWEEPDGTRWQTVFLRWRPGRIAVHLAKSHTPEVCLASAGLKLEPAAGIKTFDAGGLALPFRHYVVKDSPRGLHVFHCLWEDRADAQGFTTTRLTYANRLTPVLAGRRNTGQRSLEIALWGIADGEAAEAALKAQLPQLIVVME